MAWDTTLVDGLDLKEYADISGDTYGSVFEVVSPRGDLPEFLGVDGSPEHIDRPAPAKIVAYDLTMLGADLTEQNDSWRALQALCRPYKQVTLTRRVSYTAGNESHTAEATLHRMLPSYQGPWVTRAVVEFQLMRGMWFGGEETVEAGGTVGILGTARTERMTVTLSAGAATPGVGNLTNGYAFAYNATVPAGGVLVDVEARTATGITGSVDLSRYLIWNKRSPFRLEPGANELTVSSGDATIEYLPAYL